MLLDLSGITLTMYLTFFLVLSPQLKCKLLEGRNLPVLFTTNPSSQAPIHPWLARDTEVPRGQGIHPSNIASEQVAEVSLALQPGHSAFPHSLPTDPQLACLAPASSLQWGQSLQVFANSVPFVSPGTHGAPILAALLASLLSLVPPFLAPVAPMSSCLEGWELP